MGKKTKNLIKTVVQNYMKHDKFGVHTIIYTLSELIS